MICYMCIATPKDDNTSNVYASLLEVAIRTAKLNTSLKIKVLLDGDEHSKAYQICKEENIDVIFHSFSHKDYLQKTYPQEWAEAQFGKPLDYDKLAGTFMRFDIPFIEKEEDYVLYSDIDVVFNSDICAEKLGKPKYLAAAPEFDKDIEHMSYFNAGVMYLNVANMRKISEKVFEFLEKGERNDSGLFDQGYLNQLCFHEMDHIPLELNWKPYWGYNPQAQIIHYHGMKPGGDNTSSGFCMSDTVYITCFRGHEHNIVGFVMYMKLFFTYLGKDDDIWVNEIGTRAMNVLKASQQRDSEERIHFKDVRKYFKKKLGFLNIFAHLRTHPAGKI